jgi:hypothetical protein
MDSSTAYNTAGQLALDNGDNKVAQFHARRVLSEVRKLRSRHALEDSAVRLLSRYSAWV